MAKRSGTEDQLATLRRLRLGEGTPGAIAELGELLKHSKLHGLVLKGAAELADKWEARSLAEVLCAAAEAASPDVAGGEANKRDPGCEGKEAVLRAVVGWDAELPAFYVKAAKWVQHAPVMKGSVDVAAETRGLAAIGIAQTRAGGPEDALNMIIELLVDAEAKTRLRAAQALAIWRGPESAPLLRLKAHLGDEQPEVLGEVFAGLIRHDPRQQLSFVAGFLDDEDERVVEAAALAVGESRQAAGLEPLTGAYGRFAGHPIGSSILMSIALLRQEESLDWLLKRLAKARDREAGEIVDALHIYRGDGKVEARIKGAATERGGDAAKVFKELFEN